MSLFRPLPPLSDTAKIAQVADKCEHISNTVNGPLKLQLRDLGRIVMTCRIGFEDARTALDRIESKLK